jgi:hypothetical protein
VAPLTKTHQRASYGLAPSFQAGFTSILRLVAPASRSLATALPKGALARGLLHPRHSKSANGHRGQFLMSPRDQFRMSLDIER